jgi:hypothetical protein
MRSWGSAFSLSAAVGKPDFSWFRFAIIAKMPAVANQGFSFLAAWTGRRTELFVPGYVRIPPFQ